MDVDEDKNYIEREYDVITDKIKKKIESGNKLRTTVNKALITLTVTSLQHNYIVGKLTPLDGNCIFESMCYLGYGSTAEILRNAISLLMYEFRDFKGFFKIHSESTPKELYNMYSDTVSCVIDDINNKLLKYTYEVMCRDLSMSSSWTRIPANLLFLVLSNIFDVEIIIYDEERDTISNIKAEEKEYKNAVRLGYVASCHYVPLIKKPEKEEYSSEDVPQYKFIKAIVRSDGIA
jgi:hypothetical protein